MNPNSGKSSIFAVVGGYLFYLAYGMLMGLLIFSAIRRLIDVRIYLKQKFLCIMVLVFCLLELPIFDRAVMKSHI